MSLIFEDVRDIIEFADLKYYWFVFLEGKFWEKLLR